MINDFNPLISVETFAAYLDNNLSDASMQKVSAIIEVDRDMQQILSQSAIIDEDMMASEYLEDELPESLVTDDFDIPKIDGFVEEMTDISDDSTSPIQKHSVLDNTPHDEIPYNMEECQSGNIDQSINSGLQNQGFFETESDEPYIPEETHDKEQCLSDTDGILSGNSFMPDS